MNDKPISAKEYLSQAYRTITQGTIGEQIMKALDQKDLTQAALMEAVRAQMRRKIL